MTLIEKKAEYDRLCHAIQCAVKFERDIGSNKDQQPVELRIGLNLSMASHGGLVALLQDKGVFTPEEYLNYQIEWARRELKMFTDRYPGITFV